MGISIRSETCLSAAVPASLREIVEIAGKISAGLGMEDPSLDILITHDGSMRILNKRFLSMEGSTNVLSFPEPGGHDNASLGQLVLNVDSVKRESFLYGQDPFSYLVRLMVHGMLHLAGYEHGETMDEMARYLESSIQP